MTDKPKPPRKERFTMLEASGPLNPSPEELATRVVGLAADKERFTMLEASGPLNPSPEELATRVVEPLINGCSVPPEPEPLPPAVLNLVAELAKAVAVLDARGRAAALRYTSAKLARDAG